MVLGDAKLRFILVFLIRIYQLMPLSTHSLCRHIPTCSEYAKEAIQKYGSIKGSSLTLRRILRCRKGGTFGYDPVP